MNELRPWRTIERRKSRQIMVGKVPVGGDAPITVQTMTNTPTEDVGATIDQIRRCEDAGADIIRVSCPTEESTRHFDQITRASNIPIVADIHSYPKLTITKSGSGFTLSIPTIANRRYQLQVSNDMSSWTNSGQPTDTAADAQPALLEIAEVPSGSKRFYRMVISTVP